MTILCSCRVITKKDLVEAFNRAMAQALDGPYTFADVSRDFKAPSCGGCAPNFAEALAELHQAHQQGTITPSEEDALRWAEALQTPT